MTDGRRRHEDDATRAAAGVGGGSSGRAAPSPEPTPSGTLVPGFVLNHTYVIDRLIARGGMGEVYRARSLVDGSDVALKIIRPEFAEDAKIRTLFSREAGILRRIRHDAVVGYGGLLRDEQGRTFLVMDYVDGPSLAERLKQGPLPVEQVRRLRTRLARGLAVVHDEGTFHRDLSPDNVLLPGGDLDRATIIDFGIARLADSRAGTVIGSDFAGKYAFASPEQLGVANVPVDQRSDIYSLGLVLAAAALGRPLEMGRSWGEVVEARKRVPDLGGVPAELRPELAAMLDPDPRRRPQSMRALLGEPDAGRRGDRDAPERDGGHAIREKPSRPAGAGVSARAAAIAVLALAGGGAVAYWAYWAMQPPAPIIDVAVDGGDSAPVEEPPQQPGGVGEEPQQAARIEEPPPGGTEPAGVDRAQVEAALQSALAGTGCAELRLALNEAAGRADLTGFVGTPDDLARVAGAVRAVDGVTAVATDAVAVHPPPFCTALAVLSRETVQPEAPAGIELRPNRPDAVYREGDHFVLTVGMPPTQSGYLYVDYVDGNGDVVHLLPNPLVPDNRHEAGATVRLGVEADEVGPGRRHYVAGPPYGKSLITAIVSPEPLFEAPREEVEAAADYLPALEAKLERVDAIGAPVGAASFIEVTR